MRQPKSVLVGSCSGLVLLVLVGASCSGPPRLEGPRFPADGPPFVRGASSPGIAATAPVHRLLLLGDAGAAGPDSPVLALAARWSREAPDRTTLVYLGDNLYPAGLREGDRARGEAVLARLLDAGPAAKLFVPGNHDWGNRGTRSLRPGVLANQQRFVLRRGGGRADFRPRDGCPGPDVIPLVAPAPEAPGGLTLLALDFHWWLLPERSRPVCRGIDDTGAFLERLEEILAERREENLVIVAHHPLRSGGPHGGLTRGRWTDFGAALLHRFLASQDLVDPSYAQMIAVVSEVLERDPPLAFAAGHDHSLQVIEGGRSARVHLVSGAASRLTDVTAIPGTRFAHAHPGFLVLDLQGPDQARVAVVETGHAAPVFELALPLEPR